jgi:hypothetical protein
MLLFARWSVTRGDPGTLLLDVSAEGEGVAAVKAMFGEAPTSAAK